MMPGVPDPRRQSRNRCRNRHRMRCSEGKFGCGRRFTLPRHPDLYDVPRCRHCGSTVVNSVEKARRAEIDSKICRCGAIPFRHGRGLLRMCNYHRLADVTPTQDEWDTYERLLTTPRSLED